MNARRTGLVVVPVVLLLVPLTGRYWSFVGSVAVTSALVCLSIVVLTGWTGQLSLHQMVFAGWGAYAAFALTRAGCPVVLAIPAAALVTAPPAAAVGAVAVRFGRLETAVATLALGLVFERAGFRAIAQLLAQQESSTRFEVASVPLARPAFGGFVLTDDRWFFWLACAVAALCFAAAHRVQHGEAGRAFRAIRSSAVQAEVLGMPVLRHRLAAFVGSVSIAAVAGALSGSLTGAVTDNAFRLDESLRLLSAAVLGGVGSWPGALVGGTLAAFLPQLTRLGPLRWAGGDNLLLLYGAALVVVFAVAPGGLIDLPSRLRRPRSEGETGRGSSPVSRAAVAPEAPAATPNGSRRTVLRAEGVSVRFGGVHALDDVCIAVREGEVVAVIGPNGAGKTTLFNVVSGLVAPQKGSVFLAGVDVTHMSPARRARLGLGRTFQTLELFDRLTVIEHLMLSGVREGRVGPALLHPRRTEAGLRDAAESALQSMDLAEVAERRIDELPFGILRALELEVVLQARPKVLLLDEPSAGLDAEQTRALVERIGALAAARGIGVLFVEHDMAVVGALAQYVHVLDFGRTVSEGTPEDVRRDPTVVDAYLGLSRV